MVVLKWNLQQLFGKVKNNLKEAVGLYVEEMGIPEGIPKEKTIINVNPPA